MSSTVSAFTTRKLPSFSPTASAFPSGEKAQQRPPEEATGMSLSEKLGLRKLNELQLQGFYSKHVILKRICYLLKKIRYRGV